MGDRKRKLGSVYDEFYSRIGNKWTCRNCKSYSKEVDIGKNGTTCLSNHLKNPHLKKYEELQKQSKEKANQQPPKKSTKTETPKTEGMRQMKIGEAPVRATHDAKSVKIDQAILKFLAAAALPLSLVDHPAFRDLIRLLDSRYHLRTRKYIGFTLLNGASTVVKLCKLLGKKSSHCFAHQKSTVTNANKIENFFQWFQTNIKETINYCCFLMGSEYNSEFRKKLLEIAGKQNNIENFKIIDVHKAKICNAISRPTLIIPYEGRVLWIFEIREELLYCMIWEYHNNQWRFKTTWQKEKTIKGSDSAPTINDLREIKSKLPVGGFSPNIYVYHKFSKVDENDFKDIFTGYTTINFEDKYDWALWALFYNLYLRGDASIHYLKCDTLLSREICLLINNVKHTEVSSTEILPYTKTLNLKTKKGDVLKIKENGIITETINLSKHESTQITLEIDMNGIHTVIIKHPESNTFDSKKLYSIPKKLPKYDRELHAVGIDLGTTECCCAVIRQDGAQFVQLDSLKGARNMPSFIYFEEKDPICGQLAVDRMKNKSDFIVFDSKRFLGKNFDKIVKDQLWPFRVLQDSENLLVEVRTFFGMERKSPEEITAAMIYHIKKKTEEFEGTNLTEAVIAIPSEFTEKQKQATLTAAELAGWQTVHFIPESIAAAFAYCSAIKINNDSNILICDFGGGTVDICIAKFSNDQLQILSSDGDPYLGGRDFDNILFTHFNGILKYKSGNQNMPTQKKYALKQRCQDIKINLSAANQETLDVGDYIFDSDENIPITRREFENLTSHFMIRIQEVILRAITKANVSKDIINYVFYVGGGCRMPMVKQMLKDVFPIAKHEINLDPDWVVAHGAALYAYYLKTGKTTNTLEKIRPSSFFNKMLKSNKK